MKRITERRIAEGPEAEAAERIARDRFGVLDGVEIDFRHPDLSDEWLPRPQWYVAAVSPDHAGLLFPTEAAALANEPELRELLGPHRDLGSVVEVRSGDRLSVVKVLDAIEDGRLDHPHDRQSKRVFLRLERPSGEVVELAHPLTFYGRTQVRDGPGREAFDHILERICAHVGVEDIHGGDWEGWSAPLERGAQAFGARAHDAYFRLAARLKGEGLAPAYLRTLANTAALAGFLLAKAESRKAESVALAAERNRQLGTAKVTRLDWREKALAIWRENPSFTVNRVAHMIAEGTLDDPRSVSRGIKALKP